MNKKYLVFDCFGVILSPVISLWHSKLLLENNFKNEDFRKVLIDFDLNKIDENGLINYFLKYPFLQSDRETIQNEIDSFLEIDEDLVSLIKILKKKKFKIFLLSNANHNFFERKVYKKYPEFKDLFDDIIISSLVGLVKPNQEIFQYFVSKHNLHKSDCLFIDDNSTNVEAAKRFGIDSFLYSDVVGFETYLKNGKII